MTRKALLAALALACVASPALAGANPVCSHPECPHGASFALSLFTGSVILGALTALVALAIVAMRRLPVGRVLGLVGALAVLSLVAGPVLAAEVVTAPAAPTAVVLPWGDWIVAIGQAATAVLLPVLVGLISKAVYQVAPWAMLFLTQKRIEQMAQAVTDYALNAVGGIAKGQQLSVPVGSAVIAKAVQRAVDVVPAKVIAAAGGQNGIAEIVFRKLDLVPEATAANTLAPAQAAIQAK